MKTFLLIFMLAGSTFGIVCPNHDFCRNGKSIKIDAAAKNIPAATNHNWSNE